VTTSPFLAKPWLTRHDRRIVPTTKRLRVERARPELVRSVLETSSVVGRKPIELLFLRCCHVEVPTDAAAALFLKLVLRTILYQHFTFSYLAKKYKQKQKIYLSIKECQSSYGTTEMWNGVHLVGLRIKVLTSVSVI